MIRSSSKSAKNPSINTMPSTWVGQKTHYGQCGQSCPCCRSRCRETIGACPICSICLTIYDE